MRTQSERKMILKVFKNLLWLFVNRLGCLFFIIEIQYQKLTTKSYSRKLTIENYQWNFLLFPILISVSQFYLYLEHVLANYTG
jgi:hypothetical protein